MGSRPQAEDDAAYESALALSRLVLRIAAAGIVLVVALLAAWFLLVPWPEAHEVDDPARTVDAAPLHVDLDAVRVGPAHEPVNARLLA